MRTQGCEQLTITRTANLALSRPPSPRAVPCPWCDSHPHSSNCLHLWEWGHRTHARPGQRTSQRRFQTAISQPVNPSEGRSGRVPVWYITASVSVECPAPVGARSTCAGGTSPTLSASPSNCGSQRPPAWPALAMRGKGSTDHSAAVIHSAVTGVQGRGDRISPTQSPQAVP